MTTILLARHGQASFGQQNYDQLSELGCTQARLLGQHYAHTQRHIDAIFSGNLVRQRDSARHFWEAYQASVVADSNAPILDLSNPESYVIADFAEFNHKDVFIKSNPAFTSQAAINEELTKADEPKDRLGELFHLAMQRWHAGDNDADYIESWSQFNKRAQRALKQVQERVAQMSHLGRVGHDSTVLVFTSGGVIAAIAAKLLQQGSQTAYQINRSLVNTGITAITLPNQTPKLLSLNEYSHLFANGERFVTWR